MAPPLDCLAWPNSFWAVPKTPQAKNMQIDLTPDTLQDMVSRPPLNAVLMPIEPNSGVIKFKGNNSEPVAMPVNKAQDIVAAAAKRALK
jgi:hypothetical protein